MKNIKKIIVFSLLFFCFSIKAKFKNDSKVDSLVVSISKQKQDIDKPDLLNKIAYDAVDSDSELCEKANYALYVLSKKRDYHKGIGYYYFNAGERDFRRGNLESALGKLGKAAAIFKKIKSRDYFVLAQCSRATLLVKLQREKEGFAIVSKIAEKIINRGNYKELSYLYFFYGEYYHSNNDISASISYFNKALINARKAALPSIVLDSYGCLIDVFVEYRRFGLALRYSKLQMEALIAKEGLQGKGLPIVKAIAYCKKSNLQRYYLEKDRGLSLANVALDYAKKSKNKKVIANCLNLISLIHFDLMNYQESMAICKTVLRDYDESDAMALRMLGRNYFIIGQYEKSLSYLKKKLLNKPICNVALSFDYLGKYTVYDNLSNSEFCLKNYKRAFELKNTYVDSTVALSQKINTAIIHQDTNSYESKEVFFAKKQLFEGQSQAWISIYNARYYFWTVVLGGVVSLTFFLWYWVKSSRESKKKSLLILKLEAINKDLEKKIDFKRMLLKENHHRVKNNFQMIISLINIEIRFDKSKSIHYHIEKAEIRVGVLALLYDSFSEIETDNKIDLRVYVEKLVEYNRQMMETDQVSVTVLIDEIVMDVEIAVSLGLIINELVCNSLKHAFTKDAEGKIVIQIKQINNGIYAFNYSDNGTKGKPEIENKNSLGFQLISGLVEQIAGSSIKIDWSHGMYYEFNFTNLS